MVFARGAGLRTRLFSVEDGYLPPVVTRGPWIVSRTTRVFSHTTTFLSHPRGLNYSHEGSQLLARGAGIRGPNYSHEGSQLLAYSHEGPPFLLRSPPRCVNCPPPTFPSLLTPSCLHPWSPPWQLPGMIARLSCLSPSFRLLSGSSTSFTTRIRGTNYSMPVFSFLVHLFHAVSLSLYLLSLHSCWSLTKPICPNAAHPSARNASGSVPAIQ